MPVGFALVAPPASEFVFLLWLLGGAEAGAELRTRPGRSDDSLLSRNLDLLKNIYVGNLPFSATEAEVSQLFESHGAVQRVHLVMDRDTGRPRGFGFVEMTNDGEGTAAIEALNGSQMGGRSLTVNEARPRQPRGASGGGGGGRGGGGGGRW
jgi:cold-inducible RNA-binding protein